MKTKDDYKKKDNKAKLTKLINPVLFTFWRTYTH